MLKKITQRNGNTSEFIYDGLRIGSLTEKKSDDTVINAFAYSYDNNGNQETRTEQQGSNPAVTNNFHYDPLNRVSTSDQFNESYGYDNRGNRNSMSTSKPFESPDSTRTYDKRDRLTNVALTGSGNVSYRYNGDGLLYERTENGQTTRYYWDGDQVIAEANVVSGVATLKARYVRGQGLIAREDKQGKSYYLQNGHGDVVNLMDSTGTTKLNSYQYDIWGNIVSQQENLPQSFKYSGEMQDSTTGLQYLRARWYDPSMGRFVGEDSVTGQVYA
ncbi:RHS repeat protein [Paenibacillus aestuarii]|uniref:RHS repeat-associated core domain-containing protein n=1 Tax=Paenibacillus aestuarii TaxID=516965 RepID=A0ABW0K0I9_9BACL|nr:RHS repeat-associated core domain-containing protein [Paenibacillus aestuarii]